MKLNKPKLFKYLIFIAFALLVVVVYFLSFSGFMQSIDSQVGVDTRDTVVEIVDIDSVLHKKSDCDEKVNQIKNLIHNSKQCQSHLDCDIVYLNCPFGCFGAINIKQEGIIREAIKEHRKMSCTFCNYRCSSKKGFTSLCNNGMCETVKIE